MLPLDALEKMTVNFNVFYALVINMVMSNLNSAPVVTANRTTRRMRNIDTS